MILSLLYIVHKVDFDIQNYFYSGLNGFISNKSDGTNMNKRLSTKMNKRKYCCYVLENMLK